jgi:hypothetical protein
MLSHTKRRNRMPGRQSLGTAGGVAPAGFLLWLDHMQLVPNHREREFMQRLRGRGWVKASQIPDAAITLKHLLEKRWVERQGRGADASYRISDEGIAAKTALTPLTRRCDN